MLSQSQLRGFSEISKKKCVNFNAFRIQGDVEEVLCYIILVDLVAQFLPGKRKFVAKFTPTNFVILLIDISFINTS